MDRLMKMCIGNTMANTMVIINCMCSILDVPEEMRKDLEQILAVNHDLLTKLAKEIYCE